MLNVTVTQPTQSGYITVSPDGVARPTVSNLNFSPGETVPNLVVAPVGADGEVDLYNGSPGTVQLIADVSGYFTGGGSATNGAFTSLTPARILNTKNGTGAPQTPVGAGGTLKLTVEGVGGVPASGVAAVVLNVTVTQPTQSGYITVSPDGVARPTVSNLNFSPGETVPNLVVAPVGADGEVDLYNGSPGTVQLIADVSGYFTGVSSGALGGLTSVVGDPNADSFCGLLASGGVVCWGDNSYGELGNGTTTQSDRPTPVKGVAGIGTLTAVTQLISDSLYGGYSALLSSGGVDCWGDNQLGELGNGTSSGPDSCPGTGFAEPCSTTPVSVVGVSAAGTLSGVDQVVSDAVGHCARLGSGGVDCWGESLFGDLGDGSSTGPDSCPSACSTAPVQVEGVGGAGTLSGVSHLVSNDNDEVYCAVLLTGGGADCWGDNDRGQLGNGLSLGTVSGGTCDTGTNESRDRSDAGRRGRRKRRSHRCREHQPGWHWRYCDRRCDKLPRCSQQEASTAGVRISSVKSGTVRRRSPMFRLRS